MKNEAPPRAPYRSLPTRLMRTAAAGGISAVFELLVFKGLIIVLTPALGALSPVVANPLGFCLGAVLNYILCRLWAFDKSGRRLNREIVAFSSVVLIGLIGEFSLFTVLYALANEQFALVLKLVTMGVMFVINFLLKRQIFLSQARLQARRRLRRLEHELPRAMRVKLAIEWALQPIEAIAAEAPQKGRLLELHCRRGLTSVWIALTRPGLHVHGTSANSDLSHWPTTPKNLTLATSAPKSAEPWDAIVLADALSQLPSSKQRDLVKRCAMNLTPNGRLIIKEIAQSRFKSLMRTWFASSRHAKLTFTAIKELSRWLTEEGLSVTTQQVKGYFSSHVLLTAQNRDRTSSPDGTQ